MPNSYPTPAAHAALLVNLAATRSGCRKSRRAAALMRDGQLVLAATNGPPAARRCAGDACRPTCRAMAVHAEARLLVLAATTVDVAVSGADVVHLKADVFRDVPLPAYSLGPSCLGCASLLLDAGVAAVWLLHDTRAAMPWLLELSRPRAGQVWHDLAEGWTRYPIEIFFDLSAAASGVAIEAR